MENENNNQKTVAENQTVEASATTTAPAVAAPADDNTVTLDTPIKRGDQEIKTLTLRKPNAGELRGLSLIQLLQLDVNQVSKLLPRIATPLITEADITPMPVDDFSALGTKMLGFFLQNSSSLTA